MEPGPGHGPDPRDSDRRDVDRREDDYRVPEPRFGDRPAGGRFLDPDPERNTGSWAFEPGTREGGPGFDGDPAAPRGLTPDAGRGTTYGGSRDAGFGAPRGLGPDTPRSPGLDAPRGAALTWTRPRGAGYRPGRPTRRGL